MLIGITGYARHGKDSVADVLVKRYGYTKTSFAKPMKEAVCAVFDWTMEHIENHKEEVDLRWGISPRQALTLLGTEFGQFMLCEKYPQFKKSTGRRLWVKRALCNYKQGDKLVISDLRFPHEEEYIRELGGKIIKVERPGYPVNLDHESERCVLLVKSDFLIKNDRTLDEMHDNIIRDCSTLIFSLFAQSGRMPCV